MNADWIARIDYFAIATAAARKGVEDVKRARGDLEYLITLYGPRDVLEAAKRGLETRS
jgi:hypothetical protein